MKNCGNTKIATLVLITLLGSITSQKGRCENPRKFDVPNSAAQAQIVSKQGRAALALPNDLICEKIKKSRFSFLNCNKDWSAEEKRQKLNLLFAFEDFYIAQTRYMDYVPPGEFAGSAQAQAARSAENSSKVIHNYFDFFKTLESKGPQDLGNVSSLADADRSLNESYKKCLNSYAAEAKVAKTTALEKNESTDLFREAERKWIGYRDALARFYMSRWKFKGDPALIKDRVASKATKLQNEELVNSCGLNPNRY